MHKDIAEEDYEDVERVRFLGELPEAHDERPERVRHPLTTLHLANRLAALGVLHSIGRTIDSERCAPLESTDPVVTRAGSE